ncbi:MAG: LexA family protein [Novosphingobium sp.]
MTTKTKQRVYASNRIKELRRAQGLTQQEVAIGLSGNTTKGTVAKLETRKMALSADYIIDMARLFGVSPGELLTPRSDGLALPLIRLAEAGNWAEAMQNAVEHFVVPSTINGSHLFALRVEGDYLNQIVPRGGIVVIDPNSLDLEEGGIYLITGGKRETTIKRFVSTPPKLEACSNDPTCMPVVIGREPFVTIGRAVYALFPL